jgi:hypothetical protein
MNPNPLRWIGYLSGRELQIRSHVGDLDLDGLTPVAVVSCELRALPSRRLDTGRGDEARASRSWTVRGRMWTKPTVQADTLSTCRLPRCRLTRNEQACASS